MFDVAKAAGRIESLLARLANPAPKHGAGYPPWHMWGGSVTVEQDATILPAVVTVNTQQLLRVGYKRPETWHWVFAVQLLDAANVNTAGGQSAIVQVSFDLTVGVGRSVVTLATFEKFAYGWGTLSGSDSPNKAQLWSTQAVGPNRLQNPAAGTEVANLTSQIVSQDIQLSCRVVYNRSAGSSADRMKLQIDALMAPKTHLRPEWHLHQFPGAEE